MNNLRNLRKQKGFTLKELHEKTGIPVRTLEDWDSEKRQIQSYHRIRDLSQILGVDMDVLMKKVEQCTYEGHNAVISMSQEEEGVKVAVYIVGGQNGQNRLLHGYVDREIILEMLKSMKKSPEVKPFLCDYIKETE